MIDRTGSRRSAQAPPPEPAHACPYLGTALVPGFSEGRESPGWPGGGHRAITAA